jgi:hypothetical protein
MAVSLTLGEWYEDTCETEGFSHYTAQVTDTSFETIFQYSLISVEPISEGCDPDLYISLEGPADRSKKYSDNFIWKSTLFGADSVSLIPSDKKYKAGLYQVGIFNSKPGKFRLKFYNLRVPTEVIYPYLITSEGEEYLRYQIKYPGSSRIEVKFLDGRGMIFASFTTVRPSVSNHVYSKGHCKSTLEYREVDAFPDFPLSFTAFTSQDLESFDSQESVRLCIDSESNYKILSLTILKTSFSALISLTEVPIIDLVPDSLKESYFAFSQLFNSLDTNQLSLNARKSSSLEYDLEFTYGEIEFFNYLKVLEIVHIEPEDIIWDLGSGAGKSVISAALVYPSNQVIGVEFLPNLCEISTQLSQALLNVKIIQGDIRYQDWSDGNVIFMSSLCFLDELLEFIHRKSLECKRGTRVITLREFPKTESFKLLHVLRILMSWGRSSCYIYQKN